MSVTVTVDATWRMSRVEFTMPLDIPGTLTGFGEAVLKDPDGKVHGVMPGAVIRRNIDDVIDDTVKIDDTTTIRFAAVVEALGMFFEKWMIEDQGKETTMERVPPPAGPPTVVQGRMEIHDGEVPPPL